MGLYSVYKLTAPNGKVYVGITSRKPEYRWNKGKGYARNKHLYSAIRKYGWDNFGHEIIASDLMKETACALEKELVKICKSNQREFGYNNSIGGEAPSKGRKATKEEIEKRVAAIRMKPMSREGRENISKAKKGKPNGLDGRIGEKCAKAGIVYQIDRESNKVVSIYYGFAEMSRKTGFARTPVREVASGKRKQACGYLWQYAKRGEENVFV